MSWWKNYPWRMVQTLLREVDMADIDSKKFAKDLKDLGATVVTLNAGGIEANYPSKLEYHTINPYLTGSSLKEIVDECHKNSIKVIARTDFSKIPYAVYEKHPEWAFRTAGGGIIEQNGFVSTCQNSEYQRVKVLEILKEMFTEVPFDGLYCNMSGFFGIDYSGKMYGLCTCDSCKKAFKAAFGLDAPEEFDLRKPEVMKYIGFQSGVGRKLRENINNTLKAINEEIAVDKIDYQRTESHTDINDPIFVYSASSNSRLISGKDRRVVSDNASANFMGFRYRESNVSPNVLELRQWQNLANSGNVSAFILGRIDNTKDKAYYDKVKKVFDFHKKNEKELVGLTSDTEVLLVWKNQVGKTDPEAFGWVRALTESHIPFDEAKVASLREDIIKDKKVIILADTKDMGLNQVALIDEFVANGGKVIATMDSGLRGRADSIKSLGVKQVLGKNKNLMSSVFSVENKDSKVFSRSSVSPCIAPGAEINSVELDESSIKYLTLLPEPKYGPPEVCYAKEKSDQCGVSVYKCEKGEGIYIPFNPGTFYFNEGYINTLNFIQDILFNLCNLKDIAPKLHPSVELVRSKKDGKVYISLINASGYFGNTFFEAIPIYNIELEFEDVKKARTLNGGNIKVEANKIILNELKNFEIIILED
ncbi:MAG: beta-galactosidase [Gammaproteobacteria bacterium]|nr:beta-galactosidase [Gammaproteobacteria bacterium]